MAAPVDDKRLAVVLPFVMEFLDENDVRNVIDHRHFPFVALGLALGYVLRVIFPDLQYH